MNIISNKSDQLILFYDRSAFCFNYNYLCLLATTQTTHEFKIIYIDTKLTVAVNIFAHLVKVCAEKIPKPHNTLPSAH